MTTNNPKPKPKISRRGLAVGGALGVGALLLEWGSLRGYFDHRSSAGVADGATQRFLDSLRTNRDGVIHVGHSTHLIVVEGMRILTDPWFYDPAFGALSHEVKPAVVPSQIGSLDLILITHDHADHADLRAIDEMDKRAIVICSTNDLAARVKKRGFTDVSVLAPWQERKINDAKSVTITAVPAQHDIYEVGYVITSPSRSIYFAGDTRLHPDMPAIAERFHPDVAILPCDGTRITGGALHVMTPDDATTAAKTLGAKLKLVLPSHAEAYFSDPIAGHILASTIDRARFIFQDRMAKELPNVSCKVPAPGEIVSFSDK
jgi:L-ascorbate metabolism protein UlaG (beta-lactamase superfamily)